MATALQLHNLRVKLNDYVDKDGNILPESLQAFSNVELDALIDSAVHEVMDGVTPVTDQGESWAMLVARIDGLLMIAQDEVRRIKWSVNNKVLDETQIGPNLVKIAQELRHRYENAKKLAIKKDEIVPQTSRPVSRLMNFNDSIRPHANRNFANQDVRRNTPRGR